LRRGVVRLGLDPIARALTGQMPLLPERRPGLQIIHQIRRRRESLGAMLARGNDGTDSFARLNQTIAVYGEDAFVRSAGGRLTSGAGDLF
jgi:hypothetical protein